MNRLFKFAESYLESFDSAAAELRESTKRQDDGVKQRGYSSYNPNLPDDVELPKGDHEVYVPRRIRSPGASVVSSPISGDKPIDLQQELKKESYMSDDPKEFNGEKRRSTSHSAVIDMYEEADPLSVVSTPMNEFESTKQSSTVVTSSPDEEMVGLHLSESIIISNNEYSDNSQVKPPSNFLSPLLHSNTKSMPSILSQIRIEPEEPIIYPYSVQSSGLVLPVDLHDSLPLNNEEKTVGKQAAPVLSHTSSAPPSVNPIRKTSIGHSGEKRGIIIESEIDVHEHKQMETEPSSNQNESITTEPTTTIPSTTVDDLSTQESELVQTQSLSSSQSVSPSQFLPKLSPQTSLLGHLTPSLSLESSNESQLNKQIQDQQDMINMLNTEISILKKKNLDMDIEMDNLESSVVYKDKQLVKAGQEIESLRRDKDQLYKQIEEIKKKNEEEMQETTNIIGMKENYRLKLEQQVRENEAEMYKLKSEIEEKISTIKSYKYQLESQNKDHSEQMNNLNQQITYLQEQINEKSHYILNQDELYNKKRQDMDQKNASLTRELMILQKELESYKNTSEKPEDESSVNELEGKIISLESELSTEKQMIATIKKEKEELLHTIQAEKQEQEQIRSQYKDQIHQLEHHISEYQVRISQYEKGETEQIHIMSNKVDMLNQTISSQQLMIESIKSEKSSLEFRLAEQMREQARLRHTEKSKYFSYDIESNTTSIPHVRKISRLFCQTNNILVRKMDQLDDLFIRQFNNIVHIPLYRLVVLFYILFLTLFWISTLFFKH